MIFMLPETVRMLLNTCRELFLFSPDQETVDRIKELSGAVLCDYPFTPVFYDISRTGRRLWIAVYFQSESDCISVRAVQEATDRLNRQIAREFPDAACELILDNHPSEILRTDPEGQMA